MNSNNVYKNLPGSINNRGPRVNNDYSQSKYFVNCVNKFNFK